MTVPTPAPAGGCGYRMPDPICIKSHNSHTALLYGQSYSKLQVFRQRTLKRGGSLCGRLERIREWEQQLSVVCPGDLHTHLLASASLLLDEQVALPSTCAPFTGV